MPSISDILKKGQVGLIDKFGLHELQPVVDLVQIAVKGHSSGRNEFVHIKDDRLAFGEVKESSYTTNSLFFLLSYKDDLYNPHMYLLADITLTTVMYANATNGNIELKHFESMRDSRTHFTIKGPLRNCVLSGLENKVMSVNEAGGSKFSKGAGTNLSIKTLGSVLLQ
ncbi:PREDICTED: uncharacterized protein LOC100637277 [Amphimedon queenslandica]|uniref:Uncharacterized protein n=1 Tax=Amphimedon queenslandica TaxID=400682 RepID=A0A1X7VUE5_AMPQE|nr:PREDICTED: uncharacterized protein LOC100637277 [Amphimedon queenslandica]XP_019853629.1 PREDICTED: uncharacterized protein LOC100637277 [Amphimedon queenslandica]|eukprot:XP_003382795.1 PREDICTED: uncharacterized protein LOC100637277 [Amphimedon queenslandica]